MKLQYVLENVSAVRGMSSVIAVLLGGGDARCVADASFGHVGTIAPLRERAQAELQKQERWLEECTSDYAYWGYLGAVEFWRMVLDLVTAAELVGADNLPDVSLPPRDGIVMDLMSKQRDFGKEVLRRARESAESVDARPTDSEIGKTLGSATESLSSVPTPETGARQP